jgi:hypothetical protein
MESNRLMTATASMRRSAAVEIGQAYEIAAAGDNAPGNSEVTCSSDQRSPERHCRCIQTAWSKVV